MIRFRVLGSVQVCGEDGQRAEVPGVRRRALLALLLLNAGKVVPAPELRAGVWPETEPLRSINALHAHIARLRHNLDVHLGTGQGTNRIVWAQLGYRFVLEDGELDLYVFTALRRTARELAESAPETAADKLREALGLWSGPALADMREHGSRLSAAALRAEEHRVLAIEELVDLNLHLGRHDQIIGELEALTVEYPLRERLYKQLIIALGKTGRRAEAAGVFRQARKHMVSEFGIEPSTRLSRTVQDVLADDPLDQEDPPAPER